MKFIKLPMNLGLKVVKILSNKGYEPTKNKLGLLSLEFTPEELNHITELEFINPTTNCLEGIEFLTNLESLKISTKGETAYNNSDTSICDKDIQRISKLINLKSLTIHNQNKISWVYLDNLSNLEELNITRNSQMNEISGLDKLKHIKDFSVYGNKNLYQLSGIDELINNNELDILELDLLNFPEVEHLKSKLISMINCDFIEILVGEKNISYTYNQANLFHKKCLNIVEDIKKFCHDRRSKIVGVEKYLAENIRYDYTGRASENRAFMENGKQRGKKGGTNSAYNGIMFGFCVCEGYTRSMQYLLKLLNIKTENVSCISGANKIQINEHYHNMVKLPEDGYHSIIRIDDEDMLYCDACWDACQWQNGDQTLPYCLLTKEEISLDHTLSFEENIVANNHLKVSREQIKNILQHISIFPEQNDFDKNRSKTHFHK